MVRNEIPEEINRILKGRKYLVKGSPGMGNWAQLPWIGVFNPKITTSAQSGYYLVYLFKEDMNGVYLSINQGITEYKNKYGNKGSLEHLNNNSQIFREKIYDKSGKLLEKINLGTGNYAPFYEAGNVYAKYYSSDNLPSEESLKSDLEEFLNLYELLVDKVTPNTWITDFLEKMFRSYYNARAKQEPVVGSKLSLAFIDFKNNLKDFSNNQFYNTHKNDYETYAVSSGRGKWTNYPQVYLYDSNVRKNNKYDFYPYSIHYFFDDTIQEAYLSLSVSWGYANKFLEDTKGEFNKELRNDYFKFEASKARTKLLELRKISKESDWYIPEDPNSSTIYFKTYQKGQLPGETILQDDLIELLNLYQDLIQLEQPHTDYSILEKLFKDFKVEFLDTKLGKNHLSLYKSYCNKVNNYFKRIKDDPELVNDISDPIINYLLPIKGNPIAPAAVGSIKAFGYTDEVIPGLTETVFKLVDDLNNTNDKIQQKKLIAEFKNGPFSKGFQTAMLSPVLYCINKQYWLYNNKTVRTFNLLSEILGENDKIDGILENYIDNLDKLTNLVEDISVYIPEFSDFKVFDAFCHWMCDPKLGYYAMDREKYTDWLKINFPEEPKINNTPGTFAEFLVDEGYYFEPEMIENFLLSFKAKRFVILTGNSGTGKTKIAQLFAQYVSNSMVKNSSINTKVKVGKATKNKGWTLKKDVLKDFGIPNINGSYDIKIDGVKGKGNLYMLSQLFYANDNEIQSKLKDLEINDPDQKIDLEIILPSNEGLQYKIVPVGANWTENRHIIGFYNVITNEYITSDALELILEASKPGNKDKPFFLILDEMNLSHVERYFADFLSAMESNEYISLHKSNDKIGYPNDIKIPKNLFVIGTVNVDETTYMFSPKVLDRANVIEFSTISAKDYMLNGVTQDQLTGNVNYLENPLYEHNLVKSLSESRIENFRSYLENIETLEGNKLWDLLSDELNIFQEVLKTAGFDFGFRVIDEILRFMYVAWYYEGENEIWDNWQRYFDAQIKQKMLPRIHGSQRVLENTLNELSQLCVDYPTSKAKIEEMKDVLYKQRYVSFTN
jgi:energy-coupling factor transporter ATP-binding protein EcfA2